MGVKIPHPPKIGGFNSQRSWLYGIWSSFRQIPRTLFTCWRAPWWQADPEHERWLRLFRSRAVGTGEDPEGWLRHRPQWANRLGGNGERNATKKTVFQPRESIFWGWFHDSFTHLLIWKEWYHLAANKKSRIPMDPVSPIGNTSSCPQIYIMSTPD